jgi:hypothetical protein
MASLTFQTDLGSVSHCVKTISFDHMNDLVRHLFVMTLMSANFVSLMELVLCNLVHFYVCHDVDADSAANANKNIHRVAPTEAKMPF